MLIVVSPENDYICREILSGNQCLEVKLLPWCLLGNIQYGCMFMFFPDLEGITLERTRVLQKMPNFIRENNGINCCVDEA